MIPTKEDELLLQMDASLRGIGGALSMIREGKEMPVGFYSRKLKDAQTRYSATEVECLAIVKSIDYYSVYVIGKQFTIETNHRVHTVYPDRSGLMEKRINKMTTWSPWTN